MSLFPVTDQKKLKSKSKSKVRPDLDHRVLRVIPTGKPRLVESSTARLERAESDAWQALLSAITRSAMARLDLLSGRSGGDLVPCSWQRFTGCDAGCRCRGTGTVTVAFLRDHYTNFATEISAFARPVAGQRRSS